VKVAVVLDHGSAGPLDIGRASGHSRKILFVAVAGTLDPRAAALAAALGTLVEIDPDDPDPAAALGPHAPGGITTFSERALRRTAGLAAALGLPFHTPETARALTDKHRQRALLAAAGLPGPESRMVVDRAGLCEAVARLGGPAVVKPVRGEASADTHLVNGPETVPDGLGIGVDRPFVVEAYLRGRDEGAFGDYVSVESVVSGGEVTTIGVTGKMPLLPPFRELAQFHPCHLGPEEQHRIATLAADAARALDVRYGLLHTEIKLTPDGPRIIEVNGRIGGFVHELYRRSSRIDLLAAGLDVACGRSHGLDPQQPDRVYFQWSNMPPPEGGILRDVVGTDRVRAEPGISGYTRLVPPGTDLPVSVMTRELDQIRGDAADHRALLDTIDRALSGLRFVIEDRTGVLRSWQPSRTGLSEASPPSPPG
jgi:hypothetical protein